MLSLQQAIEIKESITSYLKATFTFRKKEVAGAFHNFIHHPTQGMFKGPYIALKLRFVKADANAVAQIPLIIKPNWPPYDHQVKAWTRLSAKDQKPRPTIVTTGTGSGKTESFLYPILDYCYQQLHRQGIKVIVLYPMNALATDQAKRLAEMIHEDDRLRGKVNAGLFIGEGNGPKGQFPKTMGEDHIIEHRDTILDSPPDILLTNFKMLDYALMKHNYHKLWGGNLKDNTLLQFLVLDELHTYDGAQGTDVANLIRRLKLKLHTPPNHLCAVGTSATIGSGPQAPQLLAEYASKVFGESIGTDAIVTENRISVDAFFGPDETLMDFMPLPQRLKNLMHHEGENFEDYLQTHIDAWQQDKTQLSQGLVQLKLVKDLVKVAGKEGGTRTVPDLLRDLSVANKNFRTLPQWDAANNYNSQERVLESLLTLIAAAKDRENPKSPFMYLQVHLWVRELSSVQYTMEQPAQFSFRDQIAATADERAALPPWYCRECNSSGWLGVKPDNRDAFSKDPNEVYEKFFSRNKNIYFLLPGGELTPDDIKATGYAPDDFLEETLHPVGLHILPKEEVGFRVQAFRKLKENKAELICPCCNNAGTVAIIGTKIPTLSSIAVSQTLATDLDPATDQNRKVLAFTNSVQDAAHQAGFIEGRNYRFTLRASIQKVINELKEPQRLDLLSGLFMDYWKRHADETGTDSLSGYLYRFFPKDYLGKASPTDFRKADRYQEHFLKEFDTRIQWEVLSEFGFKSLIGRTLEKTGASSVYFDVEKLTSAVDSLGNWLQLNDTSGTIAPDLLLRFTNLVLHRARNRGAIDHVFLKKFREEKLSLWDLNWQKDGRHFLNPKFGTRSRLPKLLTNHDSKASLLDTTHAKAINWFHAYFRKTFQQARPEPGFINEFYEQWMQALLQAGLLNRATAGEHDSYAIAASALWVKKNVKEYSCTTCGNVLYSHDDENLSAGGQCLNYRCTGVYVLELAPENNYYKAVYNRHRFPRIYAREHTGLLERKERELLEKDFKYRTRFNATNTLVATSTLEMGIDIGTLNTAYNNSVPPLPSNFLQRVGRAGRSSGAALIVNFAKNQNHDLYYYTDPLEMMQGAVNTPGCYLEAKDILRRHFTAFCFDSWTAAKPAENAIPTAVRDLKLASRNLTDASFFINRLTAFIDSNRPILTNTFLKQYDAHIAEEVFSEVATSLDSGSFNQQLIGVFERMKNELHEIYKRRKDLEDTAIALNLAKGDPALEEINREKKNLNGIKKAITGRNILEHLTNVGILPNYAFPETGVRLNAHILSNQAEGSDTVALPKDFEIIRPAAQAIKELAPDNFFYTQGYRFEITGVNTFEWSEPDNFHYKRFCSKCDHIDLDSLAPKGACPKCGDPSWQASSNVHRYAKLTAVKSYSNAGKATLSDADDDREKKHYLIINHVQLDNSTSAGAWVLKDIPFGIEYVKNATFTTVNYGRSDANDARKLKINDTEVLTKGFVTCRYCGKSSSATHLITAPKDFHYGYCKHKEVSYEPTKIDVFEELYFFREVQTEVLKIVLPVQEFNTEADIRMFEAGVDVGLKKYFKGNPGHIRILPYREFNHNTDRFDRFLLLYDTIPGGTGYLEQLFDHEEFSLLLRYGYEAIRDCDCQLVGKDGCYKCIYSYGNQYNRADLSRARAERWFSQICEKTDSWEQNPNGLSSVTNSGKIEESELEERFVKLLFLYADKTEGVSIVPVKENGTIHYELRLGKGDISALYWVHPQVPLGTKDGIAYSTRTDFLITPGSYRVCGEAYEAEIPKLAIYLDGYQFHASAAHNVFERDVAIRRAIAVSPQFKSWTLTWKDLDHWSASLGGDVTVKDELFTTYKNYFMRNYVGKLLGTITDQQKIDYSQGQTNMHRLLEQLWHPVISLYEKSWHLYAGSWTKVLLEPSFAPDKLESLLAGRLTTDSYLRSNRIRDFDALIPVEELPSFDFANWNIWVNVHQRRIFHHLILGNTNAIEKAQWENFWHVFNLFQSDSFVDVQLERGIAEKESPYLFGEVAPYYDTSLHALIRQAIEKGWVTAENVDYLDSLTDHKGDVLADAALVLVVPKIVVEPTSVESKTIFEEAGYHVYTLKQLDNIKI